MLTQKYWSFAHFIPVNSHHLMKLVFCISISILNPLRTTLHDHLERLSCWATSIQLLRGGVRKRTQILLTLKPRLFNATIETTFPDPLPSPPRISAFHTLELKTSRLSSPFSGFDHFLNAHLHHQIVHQTGLQAVNTLKYHRARHTEF